MQPPTNRVVTATHRIEERDVTVYEHDGGQLLARLYQPIGEGPFPAVVDVHGGGWTSGDRFQNALIDATLASRGIVVLALDFRMPPEAGYPAAVADVNAGIRWLKAHAPAFGARAEAVGGFGTSSGAQTLLLNALRPTDPRYAALPIGGGTDASLAFVAVGWPVADPLARFHMVQQKGNAKTVAAHLSYWHTEDAMAEGSPQLILERGEAVRTPPLLIVQGSNDANLTPDMADRFAVAYGAAGGSVRLEKFANEPHSFIKDPLDPKAAARALDLIAEFIRDGCSSPA
jgi:acetyl esterase